MPARNHRKKFGKKIASGKTCKKVTESYGRVGSLFLHTFHNGYLPQTGIGGNGNLLRELSGTGIRLKWEYSGMRKSIADNFTQTNWDNFSSFISFYSSFHYFIYTGPENFNSRINEETKIRRCFCTSPCRCVRMIFKQKKP